MEEIKENQETLKRYDELANTLMDQVKESAGEFASTTFDDLYGEDVEKYQKAMEEKARKLAEDYGGEKLTNGIAKLESLKEKYDKASEQFEKINEQIEKLKKIYEEVSEVKGKIDEINKLVAEGKIDLGRAQVLHGAVYLGKGLEYATSYVPVFGSTISTISKETMDATLKFATSRAARTTALDKCIEDPENCDPTGITPY
jgi:predicted ribosome quality control (RQC) complex YloA/Tae2 family protein